MTDINAAIDCATIESRLNYVAAVASLSPAMAVMVNDRRRGRRRYRKTRRQTMIEAITPATSASSPAGTAWRERRTATEPKYTAMT